MHKENNNFYSNFISLLILHGITYLYYNETNFLKMPLITESPGETTEPGSEGSESSGGIIIDENGDIQLPEVP